MQQDVRKPREGPRPPARTRAIPTADQPTYQPAGPSEAPSRAWLATSKCNYREHCRRPGLPCEVHRPAGSGMANSARCDQCAVPLDPKTDTCPQCGVWHGDPCESCGRRGYHLYTCPVLEACS